MTVKDILTCDCSHFNKKKFKKSPKSQAEQSLGLKRGFFEKWSKKSPFKRLFLSTKVSVMNAECHFRHSCIKNSLSMWQQTLRKN